MLGFPASDANLCRLGVLCLSLAAGAYGVTVGVGCGGASVGLGGGVESGGSGVSSSGGWVSGSGVGSTSWAESGLLYPTGPRTLFPSLASRTVPNGLPNESARA